MTEILVNDFSNILGMISGYTEMAREGLPAYNEIQDDLSEVLNACAKGKKLLNNLNALRKSSQTVNILLNVEQSIGAAINTIRATLPPNISLQYCSTIEKSFIAVDPLKLEQLLLGICLELGDRGKISKSRDSILITLGNKKVTESLKENALVEKLYAQIRIQSDEIALESSFIEQFNCNDELYLSNDDELELVLLVGRRILLDLHGEIFLDPIGLNGAAISILFPVVDKSTMEKPAYSGPPRGNGQYVLVVDDEAQVADFTARRLEKIGYQVVKKTNSREALAYFEKNHDMFSLVITDQVMPDLLGLDLAQEILKIKPEIPIVMMSGYSSGINEKKCRESGIKDLAMKPIDEMELAVIVANALR